MVRLRRTFPDQPGWTRRRSGRGFVFLDESGARLPAEAAERIRALAIPPAWRDVWITPHENGHLQAVGTDDAGRRQYLYHPQWRARRDAAKFDRVLDFGAALGRARPMLREHLALNGMPLERACAVAVRLLDLGCFRIGDDVYGDRYGSYGLTTLERAHVRRTGDVLVFRFTGKSGITHRIEIDDEPVRTAIETMRRRRDDEAALLAFRGPDGWRRLTPAIVNDYVRESTGADATAKDFRTWHGTVLAPAHPTQLRQSAGQPPLLRPKWQEAPGSAVVVRAAPRRPEPQTPPPDPGRHPAPRTPGANPRGTAGGGA